MEYTLLHAFALTKQVRTSCLIVPIHYCDDIAFLLLICKERGVEIHCVLAAGLSVVPGGRLCITGLLPAEIRVQDIAYTSGVVE